MATSREWLDRINKQLFPNHSAAASTWDSLQPEQRGLVLHAASISGTQVFKASLSNCNWRELYDRVGIRGMSQIRTGLQQARNLFNGFGTLRHNDFAPRTANRPEKRKAPVKRGPEMIIAPQILHEIEQRDQLQNTAGE
ncbi:hypothetical protein [Buttiauxella agrestis]|uniref:hypothetical protein n=1 Tax=Buttiauxella agrestis TaxID=82977 RepID=UPI00155F6E7D|nr:hypothetical protein [Buttiauxella agrestis]BCG10869.1 hypothetical protein BADSM9389_35590 [Buttiauxella agrestis]